MSNNKRINRTDVEWAALFEDFNASGLSQSVFCGQRGVNHHSFRRRYQRSLFTWRISCRLCLSDMAIAFRVVICSLTMYASSPGIEDTSTDPQFPVR